MILVGLLALALFLPLLLALRRAARGWLDLVPETLVWAWAILVVLANVLSPLGQLANRPLYAGLLVVGVIAAVVLIRWLSRRPALPSGDLPLSPWEAAPANPIWARVVFSASVTLLGAAFAWNLVASLTVEPANPDSLMYRLPRVWWYLGHGSLTHFASDVDPRTTFYPFNLTLAYLPLALFGAPAVAFNFPSLLAWLVVTIATFQLVRWMGASRHLAAFVAVLIALAPIVFVEATSGNDEIVAAAAILVSLRFALGYLRSGARLDLATAALALGCGLGTKLHFFFFWSGVLLLVAWLAFACAAHARVRRFVRCPARLRDLALALIVAAALSIPFLIYNRASSPKFAFSGDEARNTPFSLAVGTQTLSLLTAQLFLSPFPTFETAIKPVVRRRAVDAWNAWWNERVFKDVNQSRDYMFVAYRFLGVTDRMGYMHFENTEWAGLLPWLLVAVGVVLLVRRDSSDWLPAALALAMLAWWVTYGMTMKYFDTVGVYFAYPLIICGAFVAAGLRPGRSRGVAAILWTLAIVVAVGHMVLCRNVVVFHSQRSLGKVVEALWMGRPVDASAPRVGLGPTLRGLDRATLVLTHWAVPYFEIMKTAPRVPFFLRNFPAEVSGPMIFAVQAAPCFDGYMPLAVNVAPAQGLVYLDTIMCSYGREFVFGDAATFASRLPRAKNRYFVFQAQPVIAKADSSPPTFQMSPRVAGVVPGMPALRYRYRVSAPGHEEIVTDWNTEAAAELLLRGSKEDTQLAIEVAGMDGQIIGQGRFQPFRRPGPDTYLSIEP